jgi:amidase
MTLPESAHWLSAPEIGDRVFRGECSSEEITHAMFNRIEYLNPRLKPYSTILTERALTQAQALDTAVGLGISRGPLHGVPIAIKDLCDIKGEATLAGTSFLGKRGNAGTTACVVERLEAAGAVIRGKLKLTKALIRITTPA